MKYLIPTILVAIILVGFGVYQITKATEITDLTVIDSATTASPSGQILSHDARWGQSFTVTGTSTLNSVSFHVYKSTNPNNYVHAEIYDHSGTYGASSVPATAPGVAIATSASILASDLPATGATVTTFTFSGLNRIYLKPATHYVVMFVVENTVDNNVVAIQYASGIHGGNVSYASGLGWNYYATLDLLFSVNGYPSSQNLGGTINGGGYVFKQSTVSFDTARNSATGTAKPAEIYALAETARTGNSPNFTWTVSRAFLPFDTSSIPSSAIIDSATVFFWSGGIIQGTNDGHDYIGIVQTTQASSATLASADFNKADLGDGLGSYIYLHDMNSNEGARYWQFELNALGLSWIKKNGQTSTCGTTAGVTCLGAREGHDLDDVDITTYFAMNIATLQSPYADSIPYMIIMYHVPPPAHSDMAVKYYTVKIMSGKLQIKN